MPVYLLLTGSLGSASGPGHERYEYEEERSGMRNRFLGRLWWNVGQDRISLGKLTRGQGGLKCRWNFLPDL